MYHLCHSHCQIYTDRQNGFWTQSVSSNGLPPLVQENLYSGLATHKISQKQWRSVQCTTAESIFYEIQILFWHSSSPLAYTQKWFILLQEDGFLGGRGLFFKVSDSQNEHSYPESDNWCHQVSFDISSCHWTCHVNSWPHIGLYIMLLHIPYMILCDPYIPLMHAYIRACNGCTRGT